MKLFNAEQIREIDRYTISHEPVASHQLMERAALACFKFLIQHLKPGSRVLVFCGTGNNGGDGLAIARLLIEYGIPCAAILIRHSETLSSDAQLNYQRLLDLSPKNCIEIRTAEGLKKINLNAYTCLLDALLGTGLNKRVGGLLAESIELINSKNAAEVISIDIPSGLYSDRSSLDQPAIVKADLVLTFQFPKLAFLLAENSDYVKTFQVLDIGLHPEAIAAQNSKYFYTGKALIHALMVPRKTFSHKGHFGHGLLIAGSRGKSGAALIAAKACMRSGAGLLTVHSTRATLNALLRYVPEAMGDADSHPEHISELNKPEKYDAIAFGPGVGLHEESQTVLKKILQYSSSRLVIDADGLNSLSENKTWLSFLPPNTILTPHVKEFDRLTEIHSSEFDRLESLKNFSFRFRCIVILKSAYTAIAMPDGNVFFNSSGNPGLAKAGSGDGLTGILLGLLCRGYNAPQAALIGSFVHGLAADRCIKNTSMESLLISDVIEELPKAFLDIEQESASD